MKPVFLATLAACLAVPSAFGQFGGRPGDVVFYTITYNGDHEFVAQPPGTSNTAAGIAGVKVIAADSVPLVPALPFPFFRQVLYETPQELVQIGNDPENVTGLHRQLVRPVKFLVINGQTNVVYDLVGPVNSMVLAPTDLDIEDDLSIFGTLRVFLWTPGPWPFMYVVDKPGPIRPPDVPGFYYLFQQPGGVVLPALMPWTALRNTYPGANWPPGVDQKILDLDKKVGNVMRQVRIRPGISTPMFKTAGHTHLFVLQGSANIRIAGGQTIALKKHDYVFLPENLTVTLENPAPYVGPTTR